MDAFTQFCKDHDRKPKKEEVICGDTVVYRDAEDKGDNVDTGSGDPGVI